MTLTPLPEDIVIKVERAEHLVRELGSAVDAFVVNAPSTLVPVLADPPQDLGEGLVAWGARASVPTHVPGEIRAIVGDAVGNIRASLDYLARALVVAEGGTPIDGGRNSTQFPISYSDAAVAIHPHVGAEALRIVQEVQPGPVGRGSRHPLAMLRELSNEDKHRAPTVVAAGTALSGHFLARTTREDRPFGYVSPLVRWLKDGEWAVMPFLLFPATDGVTIDATLRTVLTLSGDGPVMPPIVEDIDYLLRYVRDDLIPQVEPFFSAPWDYATFSRQAVHDPIIRAHALDVPRMKVELRALIESFPAPAPGQKNLIVLAPADSINVDPRLAQFGATDTPA